MARHPDAILMGYPKNFLFNFLKEIGTHNFFIYMCFLSFNYIKKN